jgi:glucose-1-phosphatase
MEPHAMRIVCFDLGGVIVRTCSTWEEACARAGLPYRPVLDAPPTRIRLDGYEESWQRGALTEGEFHHLLSEATGRIYGPEEIRRIQDAWILGEYPEMDRLVLALNENDGILTACLSNTNEQHWRQLFDPGNAARFPATQGLRIPLASHLLGTLKPDRLAYRALETETGVRGPRVLFFDDREANIEGARRLGWKAWLVDPRGDTAATVRSVLLDEGIPTSTSGPGARAV